MYINCVLNGLKTDSPRKNIKVANNYNNTAISHFLYYKEYTESFLAVF